MTVIRDTFLQNHAKRNAWCNPWQDMQSKFILAKLTQANGDINTTRLLFADRPLPQQGVNYHVFQVGQLHPNLIGLFAPTSGWVKVSDIMAEHQVMVDIFDVAGRQHLRSEAYYAYGPSKNLVFAVRDLPQIDAPINTEATFLRIYSNNYFGSAESNTNPYQDYIRCVGGVINSNQARNDLIADYNAHVASRGIAVRGFVNGYYVKTLSPATVQVGDAAEFVVDTSIREVITYPISDLSQFVSTLDFKSKLLIKSPKDASEALSTDNYDDIDFYVVDHEDVVANKGVYYHQSQVDSVRMVTHVDYAIPLNYLQAYVNQLEQWDSLDSLSIKLFIRKAGDSRAVIDEHSRIKELYKLPYEDCAAAMTGIDASVPFWNAAALEASAYSFLLRAPEAQITTAKVVEAYGYNSLSKVTGNAPTARVMSSVATFEVPYLMREKSTAYEYDSNGVLSGAYLHAGSSFYQAVGADTTLVEFIYGTGGLEDEFCVYGHDPVNIPEGAGFRCYVCPLDGNGNTGLNWIDVTGSPDAGSGYYILEDGVLTWTFNPASHQGMVRLDTGFLAYDTLLTPNTLGYMVHSLKGADPLSLNELHLVPMAQYDYFLSGRALVRNIDYIQRGYNLIIFSKGHIVGGSTADQLLTVRGMGFCSNQLQSETTEDTGFIKYGLLSRNARFNVRDDRVMHVVVGGRLLKPTQVMYAEQEDTAGPLTAFDGLPYQVRDIVVPFAKLAGVDVYPLRVAAQARDQVVSDYLSLKLPEPSFSFPPSSMALYELYSPFLSCMIESFVRGTFNPSFLDGEYGDQDVIAAAQPFFWILDFDPTQDQNLPDRNFTMIHPHIREDAVSMPLKKYIFLQHCVRLFLHNRVSLSSFLTVAPT